MAQDLIKKKLALLPEKPGCYLMKNAAGEIIYVGKAKVLRNRVRSYFTGSHDTKTTRLVQEIRDFEYIVTGSNVEALILECNLIKKHSPRYNVLLKDDKSFPYICITNEEHPRLIVTRKVVRGKGSTSDRIRMPMPLSRRRSCLIGCIRCASAIRSRIVYASIITWVNAWHPVSIRCPLINMSRWCRRLRVS